MVDMTQWMGSDVSELIPHSGRMVLLDQVVDFDEKSTTCSAVIRPDSSFVVNGQVGPWVGLEYMAQTVAAHGGLTLKRKGQRVRIGFLLACRSISFETGPFRVGQTLHVRASPLWGDEYLLKFSCSIRDADSGKMLQEADLSIYDPGEEFTPETFLEGMAR
jgi:predicted hotdog family 3-hydroxylacyl-ACP dehydratase